MLKYELVDNQKNEWIVFVHGIGGSTKTWKKQIEDFSEHYNLLLLDLPGHGDHSNKIIRKVDVEKLHDGIKETLDHLEIKKAHFVGLSLGTIIIAHFAILHPEYVDTIIFGGATLKVHGIYKYAVILADKIKHFVPYKVLYKFFAWFLMPRKHHKKSRSIFLREVVKLNKKTMYAWIEYCQIILQPEFFFDKLNEIKKKILIISGAEDHCFLKGSKLLTEHIHNTQIRVIENCGHVCTIEKWHDFNNMALDFLRSRFQTIQQSHSC